MTKSLDTLELSGLPERLRRQIAVQAKVCDFHNNQPPNSAQSLPLGESGIVLGKSFPDLLKDFPIKDVLCETHLQIINENGSSIRSSVLIHVRLIIAFGLPFYSCAALFAQHGKLRAIAFSRAGDPYCPKDL